MMGAIDYSSIIGVILLIQIWSRGKIRYMLTLVRRSSSRRRWRRPILVHLIYIFISNFKYTILKQFLSKSYIFRIPSRNTERERSDFGYCRIFIKNNYKPMEQTDRNFIDDMTKMIIRPHRDIYTLQKLGPSQMIVKGKTSTSSDRPTFKYIEITRRDQAIDCKGKKIQLSFFTPSQPQSKKPQQSQEQNKAKRCVVYLHANSGSRVQGVDLVKYVLPIGWSMAVFDYRGSGLSEGEYTSMGVNESEDLERVLQHLSFQQKVTEFCLWGRSMGAVTILYYLTKQYFWNNLHSNIIIRAIVLDSPFSNMQKLMYQIGSSKISLPDFVFTPVINSIMERVTVKLGFNLIKQLDLLDRVKQLKQKNPDSYRLMSKVSALFLTSLEDKLVNPSHVEALHQCFPFHPNDLHYFNGQHNDNRSDNLKNKCAAFLCQIPQRKEDDKPSITSLKKSELDMKRFTEDPNKKQVQFLIGKKDTLSPKFRPKKELRVMTEDSSLHHNRDIKTSKILEDFRHNKGQTPNPTIIINNNFNLSVNVYENQKPINSQAIHEIIPPINFKGDQMQGYMTDRLNDSHIAHKYFGPYTAKVQKKQHQFISYHPHPFIISSPTSNQSNPHPSPFHKPDMLKSTHKQHNNPNKDSKIDIPKIKFEGIDYNIEKEQQPRDKLSSRDIFERQRVNMESKLSSPPPQLLQQYSSQPSPHGFHEGSEKLKLSLAELRKMQKQQQQKCVMRTSKVISVKNKLQHSEQFQKLHLKSEGNALQQSQTTKQKMAQSIPDKLSSNGSKQLRPMKTSLMQKRKTADRKNSQTAQNLRISYLNHLSKYYQQKEREKIKQPVNSPQKTLEFKVKIDHL